MLELRNVNIKAGNFKVQNVNLQINDSEYFILLGESGAGKSLILKAICGLIQIESGDIFYNNENITHLPAHKRDIGLVHQNLSLFTTLTVFENIAYSLKLKNLKKSEIRSTVLSIAKDFEIDNLLNRGVNKLSGGEKQRVALARVIAQNPRLILLDEPLSSLDVSLSHEIKSLLRKINRTAKTIIHVTHQFEEALGLANKVAVIENGEIIQEGLPQDVFNNPGSKFIANLVGMENFYSAKIIDTNKAQIFNNIIIALKTEDIGKEGYVMFNSNNVIVSKEPIDSSMINNFEGNVVDIVNHINGINLVINAGFVIHALIMEQTLNSMNIKIGSKLWVHFKATAVRFI